jgi:hypothetical protein
MTELPRLQRLDGLSPVGELVVEERSGEVAEQLRQGGEGGQGEHRHGPLQGTSPPGQDGSGQRDEGGEHAGPEQGVMKLTTTSFGRHMERQDHQRASDGEHGPQRRHDGPAQASWFLRCR